MCDKSFCLQLKLVVASSTGLCLHARWPDEISASNDHQAVAAASQSDLATMLQPLFINDDKHCRLSPLRSSQSASVHLVALGWSNLAGRRSSWTKPSLSETHN